MKKVAQYFIGLSAVMVTTVYADDGLTPIIQDPNGPVGLSADLPGLMALGAIALIAGVQIARRNNRK